MAAETKYTANTGMVTISTANSNLDGSGTLGTVITADANKNGLLIKTIKVKAIGNPGEGVIRFFLFDGQNTKGWTEIKVRPILKSANVPTF